MAGEVEREMRLFTRRLFQGTPDLGVLSQSLVRSKYLAHAGRAALSSEERLTLKKIVKEELLKMQDASDEEPLIMKVQKRPRHESGGDVAMSREPPGKRRKPVDSKSEEEDSGIEQKDGKRLSGSSPEAPASRTGKELKKKQDGQQKMGAQKKGREAESDVEEVLSEGDTDSDTGAASMKRKTGPPKAKKDKVSDASSEGEQHPAYRKVAAQDVESGSEEEGTATLKKSAQSDSESEDDLTLSSLKTSPKNLKGRSIDPKKRSIGKKASKLTAAKPAKRTLKKEPESESEASSTSDDEETVVKKKTPAKTAAKPQKGNVRATKIQKKGNKREDEVPMVKSRAKKVVPKKKGAPNKESDSESEEDVQLKKMPKKISKSEEVKSRSIRPAPESDSDESEESSSEDSEGERAAKKETAKDSDSEAETASKRSSDDEEKTAAKKDSDSEMEEDEESAVKKASRSDSEGEEVGMGKNEQGSDSEEDSSKKERGAGKKAQATKQAKKPGSPKKPASEPKKKLSGDSGESEKEEVKKNGGDSDSSELSESSKKGKADKKQIKSASKEDNPSVTRLKRYILTCGARRNYKKLFQDCRSVKAMVQVLKKELEDLGVKGKPSLEKCRLVRLKREEAAELAELDTSNIIATAGRPRRRNTWNPYQTSPSHDASPPAYSKELESDSEGEEGPPRKKRPMDWSGLKGIISDDGESD